MDSSQETCAICLGSMKAGEGQALFTAECSHVFHFNCIASNVHHGNHICPTCRSSWTHLPFRAPQPQPRPTRRSSSTTRLPNFHARGPTRPHFADDEPLPTPTPAPEGGAASSNMALPPQLGGDMTVKALPEYPALSRSDESDSFAVLVGIRAPPLSPEATDRPNTSRAPIDLVAVLDVSGSMSGDKILLLKEAVEFVINHLGPSDRLSIVTFSNSARRVTCFRRMTGRGRSKTIRAVNSLRASGDTDIIAGLETAVEVLEQRREKNPVASIILLSDGQDNQNGHGDVFLRALRRLPPSIRSRDAINASNPTAHNEAVPVHTFGFGSDHDATALHAIADGSGGTFSYIESIDVVQDAFAQCIGGLLSVVSQEAEIRIQSGSPGIRILSIPSGRYRNTISDDAQKGVIYIGDLYAEEEKQFLVYLSIPQATTHLLEVNCSYKDPLSKETKTSELKKVEIKRPLAEDLTEEDRKVCLEVERERNRVSVTEGIAEAQAMAERGDLMEAQSLLGMRMAQVKASAVWEKGDFVCDMMEDEVEELQERMKSKSMYETRGRAYALSLKSGHMSQRASTRAVSGSKRSARMATGGAMCYQTSVMKEMVKESRQQRQSTSSGKKKKKTDHTSN